MGESEAAVSMQMACKRGLVEVSVSPALLRRIPRFIQYLQGVADAADEWWPEHTCARLEEEEWHLPEPSGAWVLEIPESAVKILEPQGREMRRGLALLWLPKPLLDLGEGRYILAWVAYPQLARHSREFGEYVLEQEFADRVEDDFLRHVGRFRLGVGIAAGGPQILAKGIGRGVVYLLARITLRLSPGSRPARRREISIRRSWRRLNRQLNQLWRPKVSWGRFPRGSP